MIINRLNSQKVWVYVTDKNLINRTLEWIRIVGLLTVSLLFELIRHIHEVNDRRIIEADSTYFQRIYQLPLVQEIIETCYLGVVIQKRTKNSCSKVSQKSKKWNFVSSFNCRLLLFVSNNTTQVIVRDLQHPLMCSTIKKKKNNRLNRLWRNLDE